MSSTKFIISTEQAARNLKVQTPDNYRNVEKKYPLLVSDYYLNLIDKSRKDIENDPIWRQCMPSADELKDETSDLDPLAEEVQMVVPA